MKNQRFRFLALAFCTLLVVLNGCIELDSTLDANGAGTMVLKYKTNNSLADEKKRLTSKTVEVTEAKQGEGMVEIKVKFSDVATLPSTEIFRHCKFEVTKGENGTMRFRAKRVVPSPKELPETILDKVGRTATISVTFPGEVTETNASEKAGNKATWKMSTVDLASTPEQKFEATFRAAPVAGAKPN